MHEILPPPAPTAYQGGRGPDHDRGHGERGPASPPAASRPREDRRPHRHAERGHRRRPGGRRLRSACLKPLEASEGPCPGRGEPGPHHAGRGRGPEEFDAATSRIEEFARKAAEQRRQGHGQQPSSRRSRRSGSWNRPSSCRRRTWRRKADVDGFLDKLRMELEQAIANEERVEIR